MLPSSICSEKRVMYAEIPISTHAPHEHVVAARTRSESRSTCT